MSFGAGVSGSFCFGLVVVGKHFTFSFSGKSPLNC